MTDTALICTTSQRREKLRDRNLNQNPPKFNGIDFVEFELKGGTSAPRVYFLCGAPKDLNASQCDLYSPMLRRTVKVIDVRFLASCSDSVILETESKLCEGAAYTLTIRRTDFDPQFARFEFTAHYETVEIDPKPRPTAGHCGLTDPKINYLARDYASFRQMLLDRLAQTIPEWKERHVPDLGMTLVELFAYVGDYLAYYQDGVATEAYLNTARQRISVQRHARLVDYQLHEGCNARTFVRLEVVGTDPVILNPTDHYFITEHPDPRKRVQSVLDPSDIENLPENSIQPFEIVRWKPRCRELECHDIKNVVGLMAALVLFGKPDQTSSLFQDLARFIIERLPVDLKEQIEEYVATAYSKPPYELLEQLVRALNRILTQNCLTEVIKPEALQSYETYVRLANYLDASASDVANNVTILKQVFGDFLSRMDDSLIELHPGQNELRFYTWDRSECHLPIGTTRAVLCDDPECDPYLNESLIPAAVPYDDESVRLPNEEGTDHSDAAKQVRPFKPSRYVLAHLDFVTSDPNLPSEPQRGWNLRHLSAGDILIFEEKYGPKTHNPADANPAHRQAVKLTRVNFSVDPVSLVRIVEIEWSQDDALKFPLCISSIGPVEDGCQLKTDVSVAHGNVLLVDHGQTLPAEWIGEPLEPMRRKRCGDSYLDEVPPLAPSRSELFRPTLKEQNLTFVEKTEACTPAAKLLVQEPHKAVPELQVHAFPVATEPEDSFRDDTIAPPTLMVLDDLANPLQLLQRLTGLTEDEIRRFDVILPSQAARFLQQYRVDKNLKSLVDGMVRQQVIGRPGCSVQPTITNDRATLRQRKEASEFSKALRTAVTWNPVQHLLDSGSESQDVVVEVDNDRRTHLRFGDDDLGRRPMPKTSFYATYRVGNGVIGNVGAEKIRHLVFRTTRPSGVSSLTNPLPAEGGKEPESLDHARVHAPSQFKKQRRAITAEDYATIARREFPGEIQQARAMLNWMGTWYQVSVAIDPLSTVRNPEDLVKRVQGKLEDYRRIGHLLAVKLPTYVGLDIAMTVCVETSHLSAHVRQELLDRFSAGLLEDGTKGFFHPDRFGFGDALYLSQIFAEAKKVPGVENVDVTKFQKLGQGDQGELDSGVMNFGPLEIPRLDNDPLRPEAGCFCLRMEGTR